MEYDIRDTIANFVRNADPDFEKHREEQKRLLRRSTCINPKLGGWVDVGVEFLFSVLELEDEQFVIRLPVLAHLNKADRRRFVRLLQDHIQVCRHCALKHEDELHLNSQIERAFQPNNKFLLEELQAKTPAVPITDRTET